MNSSDAPKAVIVEQPSSKGTRFRYECEGRFNNNIYGASGKNSYPTIRILNYRGPLSIFVSCVTKDPPYAAHPHKLASGSDIHEHGICYFRVPSNEHDISFQNLSIQCIARKNVTASLEEREKAQVDPYKTGFKHKLTPRSIDLNCVRLCFHVILESGNKRIPLEPIVSEPVYDRKTAADLKITWISHKEAGTSGGVLIGILCEKISKSDIEVRFYNEDNGWEATADDPKIFKQVALIFKSPEYKTKDSKNLSKPVNVKLQLRRISNGETSPSIPFRFLPMSYGGDDQETENMLKRKRDKFAGPSGDKIRQIQAELESHPDFKNLVHFSKMNMKMEPGESQSSILKNFETKPWELPPRESAIVNQHNNIQPTSVNETPKPESEQQEEKDSTNTFSFECWMSDLKEVFGTESVTNNCDSTNVNKVALEPDNNYINVTPSITESYDNMTSLNNASNISGQQSDNSISNLDFLKSAIWENQNITKSSDLNLNLNELDAKDGVSNNEIKTEEIPDIFTKDEWIQLNL